MFDAMVDVGKVVVEMETKLEDIVFDIELTVLPIFLFFLNGVAIAGNSLVGSFKFLKADQHFLFAFIMIYFEG